MYKLDVGYTSSFSIECSVSETAWAEKQLQGTSFTKIAGRRCCQCSCWHQPLSLPVHCAGFILQLETARLFNFYCIADKSFPLQIVSGSRDKTIKLWNTLGECKFTIAEGEGHTEWVSCVRFSPVTNKPIIVSAGWDRLVKVWNLTNCKLKGDLRGHRYYINTVTVSPDGSLCASGGKVLPFHLHSFQLHIHFVSHNILPSKQDLASIAETYNHLCNL